MKVPDCIAEEIFLGERPREDARGYENLEDALHTIQESNREILERFPGDEIKRAVLAKLNAPKKSALKESASVEGAPEKTAPNRTSFPMPKGSYFLAVAACAVLALTLGVSNLRTGSSMAGEASGTEASVDRIKGGNETLFIYRMEKGNVSSLENNSEVSPGDTLQLSYIAEPNTFGTILSVDGYGSVFQHFPESGNSAAPLETGGEKLLEYSYKLDDAPDFERFFFITGKAPFSLDAFKQTLPTLVHSPRNKTLPAGELRVTEILLLK